MKILFLGDVVGKVGREVVRNNLSFIKERYAIDFTILNGENAAHGKGITQKIYKFFKNIGVDVVTLGNHAFSKREIVDCIYDCKDLIRPYNMHPLGIGRSYTVKNINGKSVAVINLCGKIFIDKEVDDPYEAMQKILNSIEADIYFIDFHAEATAEKITFFEVYKDIATAIVGTHTHVQTADERVKNGCAYITDVGMCGGYDSVLGRDIEEVIDKQVFHKQTRFKPAETPAMLCGVVITIDDATNRAIEIERIQIRP